jgi:hypothetical protein
MTHFSSEPTPFRDVCVGRPRHRPGQSLLTMPSVGTASSLGTSLVTAYLAFSDSTVQVESGVIAGVDSLQRIGLAAQHGDHGTGVFQHHADVGVLG